jgi:hypothetical protein
MINDYEIKNAKIILTQLGVPFSDHGILSFSIVLNYGDSGQSYGQLSLDTYDDKKKKRIPTTLSASLLLAINELFECNWEDLKGTYCRAYCSRTNIKAIGHLLEDKWLWFKNNGKDYEFVLTKFEEIEFE